MGRWSRIGITAGIVTTGTIAATVLVNGGGPAVTGRHGPAAYADELRTFDSCPELLSWYRAAAAREMTPYGLPGGGPIMYALDARAGAAAPEATSSAGGKAVGNGSTGTNVLVEGVDEPDLVKTDGKHIIGVSGKRLYVADATGSAPGLLGEVELPGYASELLLDGSRALVLANQGWYGGPATDIAVRPGAPGGGYGGQSTTLALVDLTDLARPKVLGSQTLDGSVLSARLVAGTTRVVISSVPQLKTTQPDYRLGKAGEALALAANRRVARTSDLKDYAPATTIRDAQGKTVRSGALNDCDQVRHPAQDSGAKTLTVLTMSLTAADPFAGQSSEAVIAEGDLVAASVDRLYVATSRWGSWMRPDEDEKVTTTLHAFDTSKAGSTSYVGSGSVAGYVLDRTAIDEHEGHLRVAVTNGIPTPPNGEGEAPPADELSQSSVVVLDETASGQLTQVGRLDGLGRGEQVRAVRWLGDFAAVVTFQLIDPLYLVDLREPAKPTLRGELEITGYSAYLHPIGDGMLLGIGHEADRNGRPLDAQVSLFDISDPDHPRRLDQELLGEGYSAVEGELRAFTYLPDRKLALLPFSGAGVSLLSLRVDGARLTRAGALENSPQPGCGDDGTSSSGTSNDSGGKEPAGVSCGYAYGDEVLRAMPVGDALVAVGYDRLRLVDPSRMAVTGELKLPVERWSR